MGLRVELDRDACTGHGRCYTLAPDVFEPDDAGYCVVRTEVVSGEALETQARSGVTNCPEQALRVEPV